MTKIIIGLGNYGKKYRNTRHNVGLNLINHKFNNVQWERFEKHGYYFYSKVNDWKIITFKPTTFMNESGIPVKKFYDFVRNTVTIFEHDLLICYDDFELPLGYIKFRSNGSAGRHKGMQSVLDQFPKGIAIPRLRIGIGPKPEGTISKDFVLEDFTPGELPKLNEVFNQTSLAIDDYISHGYIGVEFAANKFNNKLLISK